jgi:hypothetical protein
MGYAPPGSTSDGIMRMAWYLTGNRSTGSSRMECYYLHDHLNREAPGSSVIRWSPDKHGSTAGLSPESELAYLKQNQIDLVVFQKLSEAVSKELATRCRQHGIPTVFVVCDHVDGFEMVPLCTATIVTSRNLLDFIQASHPGSDVTFCQYGTESPQLAPAPVARKSRKSNLAYVGTVRLPREFGFLNRIRGTRLTTIGLLSNYDRRLNASSIARFRADLAWFLTSARHPHRVESSPWKRPISAYLPTTREWQLATVHDDLASCDIGLIPILPRELASTRGSMKSNSRLLSMWGAGLATIASPLREYVETINHGIDGFIAESRQDWIHLVKLLSANPDLRLEMGRKARTRAFEEFSLRRQFNEYLAVFRRALR